MGIFRSMREISRESRQLQRNWDPAAQARQGVEMMRAANERLAEQVALAGLAASGLPGTATVVAARDSGTRIGFEPLMGLDLLVTAGGRPPYPVTVDSVVPVVGQGRLSPGSRVSVRTDPGQPERVVVVWDEIPAG